MEGDTTLVTGGSGGRAPRRGDVLAERYEIVEELASDALVCTYRGLDQESDTAVLVRCTAPGLLGETSARRMVERVRPLIGGGGRVLSRLRDVDREGPVVLTIEPWPRGTSLRAVLDARRAKGGGRLEPREVLPVLARLAAALDSIPGASWHGDVRPERLWLDPDGLVLTGGFLLSALPGDVISGVLGDDPELRGSFAPEFAEGLGGRASDRWGVAAIAWQALTGTAISPGVLQAPPSLGAVGAALVRMLHPDPSGRPATLDALVGALADLARLPVPRVERDPFPTVAADDDADANDDPTQVAEVASDTDRPPPPSRSIPPPRLGIPGPSKRASAPPALLDPPTERMETLSAGDSDELVTTDPRARPLPPVTSDDTAPHPALGSDGRPLAGSRGDDLDPRLVRAALATDEHTLESEELELVDTNANGKRPRADDLDPRLVRAALGMSMEDDGDAPSARPARAKKASSVTQELDAGDLQELRAALPQRAAKPIAKAAAPAPAPAPVPAPRPAAARPRAARPRRDPEPVPLPTDIKGIPKPRQRESGEMAPGPVLFDASKPAPRASPPPPASAAAMAPLAIPPPAAAPPAAPPFAQPRPGPAPAPAFPSPLEAGPPAPAAPPYGAPAHGGEGYAPRLSPAPVAPRAERPTRSGPPAWASWAIVAVAVLLGLLIVGAGFWYRATLQQRDADRQQLIEQRLRELQAE